MAVTSPDGIFYADGSTPMSAAAISAAEATSVQAALSNSRAVRTYKWADEVARLAQLDMTEGDVGDQLDNDTTWRYDGTSWAIISDVFCVVRKSANQNLTTSAVPLTWDVEISDRLGMHDNTTNNSRVTAVVAGMYQFAVSAFNGNTSGMGTIQALLNGTTGIPGSFARREASGSLGAALPFHIIFSVQMAVGDYVEITVMHSSASLFVAGGTTPGAALLTARRIGR